MINLTSETISQLRDILNKAASIAIITKSNPNTDDIASSLALYLNLISTGKQVSIASNSLITVEHNRLIGVDKISQSINNSLGKNLVISFPYQEGSIEKVSYNIENNLFNLVIEPREGYKIITPDDIKYSSTGGSIDAIITINTSKLTDMDDIYKNAQELFNSATIINIDSNKNNSMYGKINIIDTNSTCTSEIIISLFSKLDMNMDSDIATNLLAGLTFGSQNFTSSSTSAETFEKAAICLRNGAKKILEDKSEPSSISTNNQQLEKNVPSYSGVNKTQKTISFKPQNKPLSSNQPESKNQAITFDTNTNQSSQPLDKNQHKQSTPSDWLKPKIYKGSTLL